MKYTRKVAKPKYLDLVHLFDQRFEKIEGKEMQTSTLKYTTILRIKINLRVDVNINEDAKIEVKKEGLLTNIRVSINSVKIIFGCILMFIFISTISYLVYPNIFALLFGVISGLITYLLARKEVNRELENYLNNLLRSNLN